MSSLRQVVSHPMTLMRCLLVHAAHALDDRIPPGNKAYDPTRAMHYIRYDSSRAESILEIQYISREECTKDMVAQLQAKRWIA